MEFPIYPFFSSLFLRKRKKNQKPHLAVCLFFYLNLRGFVALFLPVLPVTYKAKVCQATKTAWNQQTQRFRSPLDSNPEHGINCKSKGQNKGPRRPQRRRAYPGGLPRRSRAVPPRAGHFKSPKTLLLSSMLTTHTVYSLHFF